MNGSENLIGTNDGIWKKKLINDFCREINNTNWRERMRKIKIFFVSNILVMEIIEMYYKLNLLQRFKK